MASIGYSSTPSAGDDNFENNGSYEKKNWECRSGNSRNNYNKGNMRHTNFNKNNYQRKNHNEERTNGNPIYSGPFNSMHFFRSKEDISTGFHQRGEEYPPPPLIPVKLFVNRVPKWMSDDQLRTTFELYGDVIQCNILHNVLGSKGCAFVKYSDVSSAHNAIINLHNKKSLDEENGLGYVQVRYADGEIERLGLTHEALPGGETIKLFVGCLPKTCREGDLVNLFSRFGRVDEVYIIKDAEQRHSKCSAFVVFPKMSMAQAAIKYLDRQYTMKNGRRPLEVRLAESKSMKLKLQKIPGSSSGFVGPSCLDIDDMPSIGMWCNLGMTGIRRDSRSIGNLETGGIGKNSCDNSRNPYENFTNNTNYMVQASALNANSTPIYGVNSNNLPMPTLGAHNTEFSCNSSMIMNNNNFLHNRLQNIPLHLCVSHSNGLTRTTTGCSGNLNSYNHNGNHQHPNQQNQNQQQQNQLQQNQLQHDQLHQNQQQQNPLQQNQLQQNPLQQSQLQQNQLQPNQLQQNQLQQNQLQQNHLHQNQQQQNQQQNQFQQSHQHHHQHGSGMHNSHQHHNRLHNLAGTPHMHVSNLFGRSGDGNDVDFGSLTFPTYSQYVFPGHNSGLNVNSTHHPLISGYPRQGTFSTSLCRMTSVYAEPRQLFSSNRTPVESIGSSLTRTDDLTASEDTLNDTCKKDTNIPVDNANPLISVTLGTISSGINNGSNHCGNGCDQHNVNNESAGNQRSGKSCGIGLTEEINEIEEIGRTSTLNGDVHTTQSNCCTLNPLVNESGTKNDVRSIMCNGLSELLHHHHLGGNEKFVPSVHFPDSASCIMFKPLVIGSSLVESMSISSGTNEPTGKCKTCGSSGNEDDGTGSSECEHSCENVSIISMNGRFSTREEPHWKEFISIDGRRYYYNTITHVSQWEIPAQNGLYRPISGIGTMATTESSLGVSTDDHDGENVNGNNDGTNYCLGKSNGTMGSSNSYNGNVFSPM